MEKDKTEPVKEIIISSTEKNSSNNSFEPLDPNEFHEQLLAEKPPKDCRFDSMAVRPETKKVTLESYDFPEGDVQELTMENTNIHVLMTESLRVGAVKNNLFANSSTSVQSELGNDTIRKSSLDNIPEAPEEAEASGFFGHLASGLGYVYGGVKNAIL